MVEFVLSEFAMCEFVWGELFQPDVELTCVAFVFVRPTDRRWRLFSLAKELANSKAQAANRKQKLSCDCFTECLFVFILFCLFG
jgi:hypothetical protein